MLSSCRFQAAFALGAIDRAQALRIEIGDQAVIEHPGGVDDRAQRVLLGDPGEEPFHLRGVGDVAGGDLDLGPELGQLLAQLPRALCFGAAATDQEQVAGAVALCQVAGEEGAEAAGGAGDEGGLLGIRRRLRVPPSASIRARRARRGTSACPSRRASWGSSALTASAADSASRDASLAVDVDQGEAAGVLGLGGADEAPDRRRGGVGGLALDGAATAPSVISARREPSRRSSFTSTWSSARALSARRAGHLSEIGVLGPLRGDLRDQDLGRLGAGLDRLQQGRQVREAFRFQPAETRIAEDRNGWLRGIGGGLGGGLSATGGSAGSDGSAMLANHPARADPFLALPR